MKPKGLAFLRKHSGMAPTPHNVSYLTGALAETLNAPEILKTSASSQIMLERALAVSVHTTSALDHVTRQNEMKNELLHSVGGPRDQQCARGPPYSCAINEHYLQVCGNAIHGSGGGAAAAASPHAPRAPPLMLAQRTVERLTPRENLHTRHR
ncbi:hypothetical protein EVAR_4050_1 [Eumeta japonica]|uniref:Uncharacterized protein n=1 Tax=Eumeta variegata TaxID=151549 RepID=A0A4C1T3U7_EUMVA|nr:hypothetical protein EVAR_4050_1 [Eumeta japonica]